MAASKRIDAICAVITALTLALTVLFMNGAALGLTPAGDGDAGEGYFTENDLDGDWDAAGAYTVTLTGDGAKISGGAYFLDGAVHIVSAGKYVITGTLDGGQILIDAQSSDKIWLRLAGASVTNPDGAALEIGQAEKVFLTLAEGTENRLVSESFTDTASGVDGAVFSRDDLTVNGSGSLTVESAGHGIVGNDDLVIAGGRLDITAAQDGLHANDSVRIRASEITVNAGDDGVTVSNDALTGFFYMESGTLTVPACYEGVEAQQITVAGGCIDIRPQDDGFNARETGSVLTISGGSVRIVNETGRDADGLDSNGSIYITGGDVFISLSDTGGNAALDAGTETGGVCLISGGTVLAAGSAAMAESFDAASPQGFVSQTVSGAAGAQVILTDAQGQTLLSESVPCAFSSLLLSAPGLAVGDAVKLSVDGAETDITVTNQSASGFGGFGGMGGFGGGRGQRPNMSGQTDSQNPDGSGQTDAQFDMRRPGMGGQTDGQMPDMSGQTGGQIPDMDGQTNFQRPGMGAQRPNMNGQGTQTGGQTALQTEPVDPQTLLLTGVSALLLLAGILIAIKVRH